MFIELQIGDKRVVWDELTVTEALAFKCIFEILITDRLDRVE